jgi:hypothetical protein
MKKIAFCLIASGMLLTFQPTQTMAAIKTANAPTTLVVTKQLKLLRLR